MSHARKTNQSGRFGGPSAEEIPDDILDGDGIIQGSGLTGSNGLTNGNEIIDILDNGERHSVPTAPGHSLPDLHPWYHHYLTCWYTRRTSTKWIVSVLGVLLIFSTVLIQLRQDDGSSIVIDGQLGDWSGRTMIPHPGPGLWDTHPMDPDDPNGGSPAQPRLISTCGMALDGSFLFLSMQAETPLFRGAETSPDIIRILVDSDDDPGTGYRASTMGADILIEIVGYGGTIRNAFYYRYDPLRRTDTPRGDTDWNAWSPMFTVDAAHSGRGIEMRLWKDEIPLQGGRSPKALFHLSRGPHLQDMSPVVSPEGALALETASLLTDPVMVVGVEYPVLSVRLRDLAEGGGGGGRGRGGRGAGGRDSHTLSFGLYSTLGVHRIASSVLRCHSSGAEYPATVVVVGDRLVFTPGTDDRAGGSRDRNYSLFLTLTEQVTRGEALVLGVEGIDARAGITPAGTEPARAHALGVPGAPVIDGLFFEWEGPARDGWSHGASGDAPEVLIRDQPGHGEGAFLYGSFRGGLLTGMPVPPGRPLTLPTSRRGHEYPPDAGDPRVPVNVTTQSMAPLPVRSTSDALLFLFHAGTGEGYDLGHGIIATHLVEITGTGNRITSSRLLEFHGGSGSHWNWTPAGTIDAFAVGNELEFRLSLTDARLVRVHEVTPLRDAVWDCREEDRAGEGSGCPDRDGAGDTNEQTCIRPVVLSTRSGATHLCINELFPNPVSQADEWVELYNPTGNLIELEGWTLEDDAGVVWTGEASDSIESLGFFIIGLNNKLRNTGEMVLLLDPPGNELDNVTYPTFSSYRGMTFARIRDGSPYFERNPTPTRGAANNLTGPVKINEILYDVVGSEPEGEFIELYNTGDEDVSLTGWSLRNNRRTPFYLDGTIRAGGFFVVLWNHTSGDGNTYTDCFGAYGLAGTRDLVALENGDGQVVDRLTYGSEETSHYFDANGSTVGYPDSAPTVKEGESLGRYPDGADTGVNSRDFEACTATEGYGNQKVKEFGMVMAGIGGAGFLLTVSRRRSMRKGQARGGRDPPRRLATGGGENVHRRWFPFGA